MTANATTRSQDQLTREEIVDLQLACIAAMHYWMDRDHNEQVQKLGSLHKKLTILLLHSDD